ncbi:MAG: hypothetical protein M3Y33_14770, partial [Actinomycetota bacterium]|nr:hypothetical protein [Actinomycetota bacterium]
LGSATVIPVGTSSRTDDHGGHVHALSGQLAQHELPGRVGTDRRDQRDAEPEPRRGHRGGAPDDEGNARDQLLLLAERGGDIVARDEHIRIAVAEHHQVDIPGRPGFAAVKFDVDLDGKVFYPCPRGS